jgi:alpha-mannosidase
LKPAEEGIEEGVIARVWNVTEGQRELELKAEFGIAAARKVTHIETDLGPAEVVGGVVRQRLEPPQMVTFRLKTGK